MALADKKEQAFAAHICDLLEIARKSYTARFSGFLDARQLVLGARMRIRRGKRRGAFVFRRLSGCGACDARRVRTV